MKKTYQSLALLVAFSGLTNAFDYKFSGGVEFFSKVGFNNQTVNPATNAFPTDTWGSLSTKLQVDLDLLPQELKDSGQSLTAGIGAFTGGLIFDSTKNISSLPGYTTLSGTAVGYGNSLVRDQYFNDNFVIHNLYVDYKLKRGDHSFNIKAGRYESTAQFMSGYTQGFEADYKYKGLEIWWFSSYGRAFASSEWSYSWYSPKVHGSTNYGIHVFKPSYTSDSGFYFSPWIQFSPDFYFTPILELGFDSNPKFAGEGFRSTTKIYFMSPFHTEAGQKDYRYQFLAGKGGQTLAVQQRFDIYKYHFGLGWYQNWGNANAQFGTYGNAAIGPWDFWNNTGYNFGSLSNALTKDAKTGYIYVGASYGKFSWDLLGRLTYSILADEQSVPLNLAYNVNQHFKVWLRLEWQNVTTKAGAVITAPTGNSPAVYGQYILKSSRTDDRSYAMVNVGYYF